MANAREQAREVAKGCLPAIQEPHRVKARMLVADAVSDVWEPLLRAVVEGVDDCWFDHDGNCQEHLYFEGGRCPVGVAREALGG